VTIEFNCPDCNKLLRTTDEKAGLTAKCPGCGTTISVPGADQFSNAAPFDVREYDDSHEQDPDARSESDIKTCPMCGAQVEAAVRRCQNCGEDILAAPRRYASMQLKPHRGVVILVFAILSWVICFGFGIAAWIMANKDLQEMKAGRMDPSGEGITFAGKIIVMIQIILLCVGFLLTCLLMILSGIGAVL
jgi:DNA-directed RNA polymerase subunit RPC12/RpoP